MPPLLLRKQCSIAGECTVLSAKPCIHLWVWPKEVGAGAGCSAATCAEDLLSSLGTTSLGRPISIQNLFLVGWFRCMFYCAILILQCKQYFPKRRSLKQCIDIQFVHPFLQTWSSLKVSLEEFWSVLQTKPQALSSDIIASLFPLEAFHAALLRILLAFFMDILYCSLIIVQWSNNIPHFFFFLVIPK